MDWILPTKRKTRKNEVESELSRVAFEFLDDLIHYELEIEKRLGYNAEGMRRALDLIKNSGKFDQDLIYFLKEILGGQVLNYAEFDRKFLMPEEKHRILDLVQNKLFRLAEAIENGQENLPVAECLS